MVAELIRLRTAPDVDLWLHLRLGAELRDGTRFGALPDPLVVLADRPYVPTQWLSEVAGSLVEQAWASPACTPSGPWVSSCSSASSTGRRGGGPVRSPPCW